MMVQILPEIQSKSGRLADLLAPTVGQGLGEMYANYSANKALDTVLKDKSLANASLDEKANALEQVLRPYGRIGQALFERRYGMEAKEQEALQAKRRGTATARYLRNETLTPDEAASLSPEEQVKMYEARNPKPMGGVTAQSVPQEISQKINEVIRDSEGLTADAVKLKLDEAGIPPIYTSEYIENRRKAQETDWKRDYEIHKESEKFSDELRKHAETARKNIPIIENSIRSVKEGKIKPNSLAAVLKGTGTIGDKISDYLLNPDQGRLNAAMVDLLEGRKEIFGVRLSDADLRVVQDKLPSIGKSETANLAILDVLKRAAERSVKMEKAGEDVLEKEGLPYRGSYLRPLGYPAKVAQAFEAGEEKEREALSSRQVYEQPKGMIVVQDKQGNFFELPAEQKDEALRLGYKWVM